MNHFDIDIYHVVIGSLIFLYSERISEFFLAMSVD